MKGRIPKVSVRSALRSVIAVGAAVIVLVGVAACGSSSNSKSAAGSTSAVGSQLTLGDFAAPTTLNPALGCCGYVQGLAYDSLIYQDSSGRFEPDLATSWHYAGKTRSVFDITLRKGVHFSDGSPLTAETVKNWLMYFKSAKGPVANQATFSSITVTGPLTLAIHLNAPNPLMPLLLDQENSMGDVMCPALVRSPKTATTKTCGAGPYVLDASQTVPGDHYTMVPNPHYFDKQLIHYHKVVDKVIADPNSTLQAMVTGQIDLAQGAGNTVAAARSRGLHVSGSPTTFNGIQLVDVHGKLVKALSDVRVRQALNYAIDRKKITKALYPTAGVALATDQISVPGQDGWVPSYANRYPYDPQKAKQLLAAAGYPHGFTLNVVSTPLVSLDQLVQAVSSYWQAIGVHVHIQSDAQQSQYMTDLSSGKFPAYAIVYGAQATWITWAGLLAPNSPRNPFHVSDPTMVSLYHRASAAPPRTAAGLWQQVNKRVVDQAWFAPVSMQNIIWYARSGLGGATATAARPIIDPRDIHPEK